MEIGWIDFSRNERSKVLNVLASLGERGTLDELGISPIRDGFAELFFPGTSTLQTKAKYFLIIPYACRTVELSDISTPEKASEMLYEIESVAKSSARYIAITDKELSGTMRSDGRIGSSAPPPFSIGRDFANSVSLRGTSSPFRAISK